MANRKKTPDILGDLLGGGKPPDTRQKSKTGSQGRQTSLPLSHVDEATPSSKPVRPADADVEYFESLLFRGASALELVAEVLGRKRLLQWLDEMKEAFGGGDSEGVRESTPMAFKQTVATWAENRLGAATTTVGYLANGLSVKEPYEVDVWAHFEGESSRSDLEIWIECRDGKTSIKQKDISNLIIRATDVFHAAHTVKQDFWFDRLMIVSSASFEPAALEMADQHGVVCVLYDGTGCMIRTEDNWKLKPDWLRKAELSKGPAGV